MRAITPGHKYQLDHFQNKNGWEYLQFFERDAGGKIINDGTTNEEVLAMLIDRLKAVNERVPARETSIAVTKIEEALLWLNKRTTDRKARGVEGTFHV
jgi:hypothetical protein